MELLGLYMAQWSSFLLLRVQRGGDMQKQTCVRGWHQRVPLHASANEGSEQKSFLENQTRHLPGLTTLGYNLGKQSASGVL